LPYLHAVSIIYGNDIIQVAMKEITPTVGFNVEQFARSGINFTVFDMSGAGKYRPLWEHYFKDANAIIFVIDCSDKLRMCRVKEELKMLLEHPDTKGIPTLFFANKIDISDHLNPVECVQYLDLDSVKDRPWHITPSNALTGAAYFCCPLMLSKHISQDSDWKMELAGYLSICE
jgi:small GTP-binding protein